MCIRDRHTAITISSYPVPLNVREGTTFTLTCNHNPHTFHSWRHPSIGEVSSDTGHLRIQVAESAHISTLIVDDATQSVDEGEYTCYARTSDGNMVTQTIHARLFEAVQISTPTDQIYTALQGDSATVSLHCSAVNHDEIIWRRESDSSEVRTTSDGHFVVSSDRLTISNVRFSDNGTYICTARNLVTEVYIIAHLVVQGKLSSSVFLMHHT